MPDKTARLLQWTLELCPTASRAGIGCFARQRPPQEDSKPDAYFDPASSATPARSYVPRAQLRAREGVQVAVRTLSHNVVGTNFFMQTLELALVLQDVEYGADGEILGFDLYPYAEDQTQAVRRAILQWEFSCDLAAKIERTALSEGRALADAPGGQPAVYRALGLDAAFGAEVARRRQERRERRGRSELRGRA